MNQKRGQKLPVVTSVIIVISLLLLIPSAFQTSASWGRNGSFTHLPRAQATTTTHALKTTICLNKRTRTTQPLSLKIALVRPVFTATPYSQYAYGSFYAFYHKYGNVKKNNITTDLNWLNTSISSGMGYSGGWGLSYGLYEFLNSQSARNCGLILGSNVFAISDINVTEGGLFHENGASRFNVVIVGFSEYVTSQEYDAYMQFVANGGTLILMDSDSFQVRVGYSATSGHEWLILGHGWAFNGKTAWQSVGNAWRKGDINWVGSTLCCFHRFDYSNGAVPNQKNAMGASLQRMFGSNLFTSYRSHEENGVRNLSDTSLIATFANQSGTLVASYIHNYKVGSVVCLCVFGDDIISYDQSAQYFLVLAVYRSLAPPISIQTTRTTPTVIMSSCSTLAKNSTLSHSITRNLNPGDSIPRAPPFFESLLFLVAIVATAAIGLGFFVRSAKKSEKP